MSFKILTLKVIVRMIRIFLNFEIHPTLSQWVSLVLLLYFIYNMAPGIGDEKHHLGKEANMGEPLPVRHKGEVKESVTQGQGEGRK